MSNFRDVGPLYCETPAALPATADNRPDAFPLEPINVATSFVPALCGVVALWWLYRRGQLVSLLAIPATATLVVGVGSVLWHGLRTELALYLDWMPGFFAFLFFMWLWPATLYNRWWGYGTVVGMFAIVLALGPIVASVIPSNGPPAALFFVVAAVASWLLSTTWQQAGHVVWYGIAMLLLAAGAATSRTIDLMTCGLLPGWGTHAFWHIGLGLSAACGVIMLGLLREQKDVESN